MNDSEPGGGLEDGDPIAVGGFEIVEVLGRGDMGSVYRARQRQLERQVVVKVLDPKLALEPEQVERFLREARSAARLRHPNIIQLVDVGTCAETRLHYLVCEFVAGETLEALIEREGRLEERRAYEICFGLASALRCAEENGIIHRDVKPENVMLTQSGRPKLCDLGLAKRQDDHSLTLQGAQLGSPHYVSPEMASGAHAVDIRGDVYSLGITLYRMLTGALPYDGETYVELAERHIMEDVPDPREVQPSLSADATALVRSMCARDPDARYQSAEDLERDLARVLGGREPQGAQATRGGGTSLTLAKQIQDAASDSRPPTMPFEVTVCRGGVMISVHAFDRDRVVIGRSSTCDVPIDEDVVSRRHAEITRLGMTLNLTPLSKTNATSVNGEAIDHTTLLRMDDAVTLSEEIELLLAWVKPAAPSVDLDNGDTPVMQSPKSTAKSTPALEPDPADLSRGFASDADAGAAPGSDTESPYAESPYAESPYAESPYAESPYAESPYATEPASGDSVGSESARAAPDRGQQDPSTDPQSPAHRSRRSEPQAELRPPSEPGWVLPAGYVIHPRAGGSSRTHVAKGFQLGSSSLCDVRLPSPAPRKAALIVRCSDCYWLWNVSDDSGAVTLNNEAVPDQAALEDGDVIEVFGVAVRFEQGA